MLFRAETLHALVTRIFECAGSERQEAERVADHIVDAGLAGHDSHGMIRVLSYVSAMKKGQLVPNRHVSVVFETDTIAVLDGQHGFGQVVATEATDIGIAKARGSGIAMVTLRNAGHIGRLGAYAERAATAAQATIYFVNSARPGGAQLAPFGGTDRRLNSGPICLGMPVAGGDPIVLDISTAAVAMGKIRLARNKGERLREPCIVDAQGNPSDDPNALYGPPPGAVLPFGGHKGSGLCMFTDLFGGILTGGGAEYEGAPSEWYPINSMLAVHIDLAALGDPAAFTAQVRRYAEWVKASPPQQPGASVLMPGEYEQENRRKRRESGLDVDQATWSQVLQAAEMAGLMPAEIDALLGRQRR